MKYIKTYTNIDNLSTMDRQKSSMKMVVAFLLILGAIVVYIFLLRKVVRPALGVLILIIFSLRILMILPGEEKKRMLEYREKFKNKYITIDKLSDISVITDSNIVMNDQRVYKYIYLEPNFCKSIEDYEKSVATMLELFGTYDLALYVLSDKNSYKYGNINALNKYKNATVLKQRLNLIKDANKSIENDNTLYTYLLCIKTYTSGIEELNEIVRKFTKSDSIKAFGLVKVLTEVNDVCEAISRVTGTRVTIEDLVGSVDLTEKEFDDIITYRR